VYDASGEVECPALKVPPAGVVHLLFFSRFFNDAKWDFECTVFFFTDDDDEIIIIRVFPPPVFDDASEEIESCVLPYHTGC
jgi:hypothetical protein